MRITPLRAVLLLTLAGTAGCTDGFLPPRVNFADAIAMPSCGPADGGAVAIFLTSKPIESDAPAAPYLRVDIWRSLSELSNQTFMLDPGSQSATAFYIANESSSSIVQVSGGTVSISSAAVETGIRGEVNTIIPDHGVVRGNFNARWIPIRTTLDLCG